MGLSLSFMETAQVFCIMKDLIHGYDRADVRERDGHQLMNLLKADYFASSIWSGDIGELQAGRPNNMTAGNISRHEDYF